MFILIVTLFATAVSARITFDRRQDGDFNAQVDISNILLVIGLPKMSANNLLDLLMKNAKYQKHGEDRADGMVAAFLEPNKPYQVDIGSENNGRAADVVIVSKPRLDSDEDEGMKLLGSVSNCGPERVRDPITYLCKDIDNSTPNSATESNDAQEPSINKVNESIVAKVLNNS